MIVTQSSRSAGGMIISFEICGFLYSGKWLVGLRESVGKWFGGGTVAGVFGVDGFVCRSFPVAVEDDGPMY